MSVWEGGKELLYVLNGLFEEIVIHEFTGFCKMMVVPNFLVITTYKLLVLIIGVRFLRRQPQEPNTKNNFLQHLSAPLSFHRSHQV